MMSQWTLRQLLTGQLAVLLLVAAAACDGSQPIGTTDTGLHDARPNEAGAGIDGAVDQSGSLADATALLANGSDCTKPELCASGHCVDGVCCNAACNGPCQRCDATGTAGKCTAVPDGASPPQGKSCPATAPAECGGDGLCNGAGKCRLWPTGTVCQPPACEASPSPLKLQLSKICDGKGDCLAIGVLDCAPYRCDPKNNACFTSCPAGNECQPGNTCTNNQCGKLPLGATCIASKDCQSGHCTQDVCCDTACAGQCQTCVLPTAAGLCVNVLAGVKPDPGKECAPTPDNPCAFTGSCDGAGSCAVAAAGAKCGTSLCIDALTQSDATYLQCNGDAKAPQCTEVVASCKDYRCAANGATCLTTCQSKADCQKGLVCTGGKCVACGIDADCGVGRVCVGGVCQECGKSADCPSGMICVDKTCVECELPADCSSQICLDHRCVDCIGPSDCAPNLTCYKNRCIECLYNSECPQGKTCLGGMCS